VPLLAHAGVLHIGHIRVVVYLECDDTCFAFFEFNFDANPIKNEGPGASTATYRSYRSIKTCSKNC